MSYRDDLEALSQRVQALERTRFANGAELADAKRLLEQAKQRARLPVLENLHIAAPCKADWNQMLGDERARFCGQCEKNVYNLSSMTRAEAEALLIEKEGRLCVRYYQRADGTVLTADCPDGLVRRRRRTRVIASSLAAMSAVAAAASALVPRAGTMGAPMGQVVAPTNIGIPTDPVPMPIMGARPRMGEMAATPRLPKPRPPKPAPEAMMGGPRMGDTAER